MTPLYIKASINYTLIRSRAAEMGLADRTFTDLIGVRLRDLEADLDQRAVSLTMLARLSSVLGVTLDQLVTMDGEPPPALPATADSSDADLLLALLLSYGSLGVEQLLDALNWNRQRLAAAATTAEAAIAATPLGLVVTDQRIACVLRPGALPADVRARLDEGVRTREPLQAHEISRALSLVPNEILGRFHDDPQRYPTTSLTELADRGLVFAVTPCADNAEQATARPHPDLMFALRLSDTPHPDNPNGS